MIATQVKVKLINEDHMGSFYFCKDQTSNAQHLLATGQYREAGEFAVEGTGSDAAEEVFDLTNNPYRQDEREQLYGRGRSLSVGDIVEVGEEQFLCASMGWQKIS